LVHRRLRRVRSWFRYPERSANARAGLAIGLAAAALLVGPGSAAADNTRVSIFDYQWSNKEVHINLGEKVTWDWLGPDLEHSVTGISPDDLQWDSDPGTDVPRHRAGDEYTLEFTQPGVYLFQCKLHAWVHGEVVVGDTPGNPFSNPGPRPPLNIDLTPPTIGDVKLRRTKLRGDKGTAMRASISEGGKLDAEYYRLDSKGHRVYNGYHEWGTFLGINHIRLAARRPHFKARPGRYLAVLRATDESQNTSKPVTKVFTILGATPRTRRPGEKP
jgi:plastocyanin